MAKNTTMRILIVGAALLWSTGVAAHSPLSGTTPAHEAIIAEVPTEVLLEFEGNIHLTRVTMTHEDHPSVDMDLTGHSGFISSYAIPVQPMGKGEYVIEWRGLGTDGHALTGSFHFTVE